MSPASRHLASASLVVILTAVLALAADQRADAQAFGRAPAACTVPAPIPTAPAGETPDRMAVVVAMRPVTDSIRTCLGGAHAELQTRFVFRGADGVATEVQIVEAGSTPPSDGVLRCVEAAACLAHVSPFSAPSFTVSFPFRF